jgi:hypothetical protein
MTAAVPFGRDTSFFSTGCKNYLSINVDQGQLKKKYTIEECRICLHQIFLI